MDPNRSLWNEQHKRLRQALTKPEDHEAAIDLFLRQHAMGHDEAVSSTRIPSFSDEVWENVNEPVVRCLPSKYEHSIAWLIWHIARIEDMTVNVLLAGMLQIFHRDDWLTKLDITIRHTGNVVMDRASVTELSNRIDIDALKAYRMAVGRATR